MPDEGTGNVIFVLRRLVERSVEKQRDVYTCVIDYSKAFDTVKHESLVELLQSLDVDKSETRLITNLYWKQTAAVRCGDDISEWLDIKQGVRQGCVASPHLFALYTEMIMRELDDMDGFRIGGTVVNNLRYADNTVIIAESEEQLQRLINVVVTKSEEKGLYWNSAVLHHGVFEGFTNMQHQCPRQDTGTSALVCILRKSVHLRCKKEEWDREVCFNIHEQSVDIKGYTYDSSHQSAEMLCVVNTAIWM